MFPVSTISGSHFYISTALNLCIILEKKIMTFIPRDPYLSETWLYSNGNCKHISSFHILITVHIFHVEYSCNHVEPYGLIGQTMVLLLKNINDVICDLCYVGNCEFLIKTYVQVLNLYLQADSFNTSTLMDRTVPCIFNRALLTVKHTWCCQ